ncbi:MAG TPA: Flp pilus assembly protein CpaB [Bryobacteraceae bacterium]|nr:Flp pilus assembly protein CpaB [Bryobacteraceae bacterium]
MKRNLFPFLGIAFVVAIAATGVFYGLFVGKISAAAPAAAVHAAGTVVAVRAVERGMVLTQADLRLEPAKGQRPEGALGSVEEAVGRTVMKSLAANEAVTAAGLATARATAGGLVIPNGMRAISVRVADSMGLVPFLRPGHRVDVQSIHTQASGEPAARTLLSNVEVLNVYADTGPQPAMVTVLNLLVAAKDVERVALADSSAKVRIVLRNAEDREESPIVAPAQRHSRAALPAAALTAGPHVQFQVKMAVAAAETVWAITARTGQAAGPGGLRIGLLPTDWELSRETAVRVLATESVDSAQWQEVSLQAGGEANKEYDLRLRLMPRGVGNGVMRLRVKPELTLPQRGGMSSRRFSADLNVADGQSVLVAGFERDASAPALIEKLFHSQAPQPPDSELLLVVTPRRVAR